jgi:hypothetical protein
MLTAPRTRPTVKVLQNGLAHDRSLVLSTTILYCSEVERCESASLRVCELRAAAARTAATAGNRPSSVWSVCVRQREQADQDPKPTMHVVLQLSCNWPSPGGWLSLAHRFLWAHRPPLVVPAHFWIVNLFPPQPSIPFTPPPDRGTNSSFCSQHRAPDS